MASQSKAAESPRRKALVAEISSNTLRDDHKRDASAFVSARALDWVEMTRPRARNDAAQAVWARHSCLECGPDMLVWPRARKVPDRNVWPAHHSSRRKPTFIFT